MENTSLQIKTIMETDVLNIKVENGSLNTFFGLQKKGMRHRC